MFKWYTWIYSNELNFFVNIEWLLRIPRTVHGTPRTYNNKHFEMMHNLQTQESVFFKNKHVTTYVQFYINHKQAKQTLLNMTIWGLISNKSCEQCATSVVIEQLAWLLDCCDGQKTKKNKKLVCIWRKYFLNESCPLLMTKQYKKQVQS